MSDENIQDVTQPDVAVNKLIDNILTSIRGHNPDIEIPESFVELISGICQKAVGVGILLGQKIASEAIMKSVMAEKH